MDISIFTLEESENQALFHFNSLAAFLSLRILCGGCRGRGGHVVIPALQKEACLT
jgi:hypothetical protein